MYFGANLESQTISSEDGDVFSIDQFKKILERASGALDMTMMLQRLISFDYDFNRLESYYNETDQQFKKEKSRVMKLRRRVEDALRKNCPDETLLKIANMLNVKTTDV